ncbi:MAG: DHA2 family efflux MFS transporter permease subunit [Chlamydiales bacterium]|nr:DHA2 family efflux MFS transporter permease subunit [Chlamydiales bacterium]
MTDNKYLDGPVLLILNILISLTAFMYVLDYSVANVAIPYIAGDLAVSNDQGTYVITAFAVGNAIGLPLTGWLASRFGRVRVFVSSIFLFTLLSWVCGAALSFPMLVIGRFIQGLVAGPLIPLSQGFIGEVNPPKKVTKAIAVWALIIIVAPVVGPVVGGWICVNYTWPWIFFINIPIGVICTIGIGLILKRRESKIVQMPFDGVGFLLFAVAATCLQIFLDKGQEWDWFNSHRITILCITFSLCYIYLIPYQLIKKNPFLRLHVFKIRSFSLSCIIMAVLYASYFGSIVLIPLWLQTYMGYDAYWAGIAIAPLGIAPVLLSSLVPKLIDLFGELLLIMCTMIFFIISFVYFLTFTTNVDIVHIGISRALMGIGFATYAAPMMLLAMKGISQEDMPGALGIFHFVRSLFGGIGTAVFTTIWQRRTIFHHERIAETVNVFQDSTLENLGTLQSLRYTYEMARQTINNIADRQAAFLALLDSFYVMIWACVFLFFLTLWFRMTSKAKVPIWEKIKARING